jgi:TonB family protein
MNRDSRQELLEMYATSENDGILKHDIFPIIAIISLVIFTSAGIYLHKHLPAPKTIDEKISQIATRYILDEKSSVVIKQVIEKKKAEKPKIKEIEKPKEPIDLTQKPVLNQPKNEIEKTQPTTEQPKVVRRVYGLKKVYSTGIGSGGNAADAVIGKLGNTLNTPIDTFSVTEKELKGNLVSVTTVTTLPRIKSIVKPEYTKEMIENKIEGVVKVKVQVDIDGKVKKAIVLNDLGYGTKEKVLDACLKLEFEPASINGVPCAVWIIVPITFKMLNLT